MKTINFIAFVLCLLGLSLQIVKADWQSSHKYLNCQLLIPDSPCIVNGTECYGPDMRDKIICDNWNPYVNESVSAHSRCKPPAPEPHVPVNVSKPYVPMMNVSAPRQVSRIEARGYVPEGKWKTYRPPGITCCKLWPGCYEALKGKSMPPDGLNIYREDWEYHSPMAKCCLTLWQSQCTHDEGRFPVHYPRQWNPESMCSNPSDW